jgi:hypothetical protein
MKAAHLGVASSSFKTAQPLDDAIAESTVKRFSMKALAELLDDLTEIMHVFLDDSARLP